MATVTVFPARGTIENKNITVYKPSFRKVYYFHKKINTTEIRKEKLIEGIYYKQSAFVNFNGKSKVYFQYDKNNKQTYTRVITFQKNIVENRTILSIGDSSMTETIITNKNGQKQRHLKIITKQDGTRK